MPRKPTKNPMLCPAVNRLSRSAAFKKTFGWKKKKASEWKVVPKKVAEIKKKVRKFGTSTREIKKKAPRFYPEEDVPHRLASRKHKHRPTRLRKSIQPGTVLILITGRYRGSRVVFLKQLKSGLLLINGPFKVNGVPLRRVNQAYVIATSTRVDISGIKIDDKIDDKYFYAQRKTKKGGKEEKKKDVKKDASAVEKKDEKKSGGVKKTKQEKKDAKKKDAAAKKDAKKKKDSKKAKKLKEAKKKKDPNAPKKKNSKVSSARITDQKAIDAALITQIKKVPLLKKYLRSKFSLKKGNLPHLMKF
jgi:large subunit ribosomal protein L6e